MHGVLTTHGTNSSVDDKRADEYILDVAFYSSPIEVLLDCVAVAWNLYAKSVAKPRELRKS